VTDKGDNPSPHCKTIDITHIGLLGVAHIHTPHFVQRLKARTDVHVKQVWDPDPARATKAAAELGTSVSSDPAATINDPEVAAVVVCAETNRHKDLVPRVAAARKHLFVEKPLGFAAADALAMAEDVEKAGVLFQTGYFMRGAPEVQFIRQHLAAGSFGKITRIRHSTCHAGALGGWFDTDWRWMADPKLAGCGAFGDLGTHSLDLVLYLLGQADSATASIDNVTKRYGDCDEVGEGMIKFKSGAIGTIAASWLDVANPYTLQLAGTEGHALICDGKLYVTSKHIEGADGKQPWTQLPPAWPHAFDLFLDAITGKPNVPLVGAKEAAYRNVVMEAMYTGANAGTWVKVK